MALAGMREPVARGRAYVVAASLAVAPDFDILPGILLGQGAAYHGTATHSIAAVITVLLITRWLAGWRWAAVAALGNASHLVVDLLDDRGRTNVLLGWPFTLERPLAIARLFPTVPFAQGDGAAGAALSLLRPAVLQALAVQTLVGLAGCLLLLGAAYAVLRLRAART